MKLILLFGDDTQKLSERFDAFVKECRKRKWNILYPQPDPVSLYDAILSNDLFSNDKIVVLEKYNLVDKKFLKWLDKHGKKVQTTLVLYIKGLLQAHL